MTVRRPPESGQDQHRQHQAKDGKFPSHKKRRLWVDSNADIPLISRYAVTDRRLKARRPQKPNGISTERVKVRCRQVLDYGSIIENHSACMDFKAHADL